MYLRKAISFRYDFSIITLGAISCIAQLILLREFLSVLNGNELSSGIIFANWMLATALGSRLGMLIKSTPRDYIIIITQLLISILPAVSLFALRMLRYSIFYVGIDLSIFEIALFSFLLLLPYCLSSGFSFTLYSKALSRQENQINSVYFRDNIGMVIGGVIFSFILVFFFNPTDIVLILVWIGFISTIILLGKNHKLQILFVVIALLGIQIAFNQIDIELLTKSYLYKNQNIIYNKETPYGNIILTKTQEQINYYCNGVILANSQSIAEDEELAHFAMVQKDSVRNVMLISGILTGVAKEVKKYNPQSIHIIEINPELIKLANEWTDNLKDGTIKAVNIDPTIYINKTTNKYDVVINCLSTADNLLTNRFFTSEFISDLKKILTDDAVIIMSSSETENYINEQSAKSLSILYNTLKKHFKNVLIIPSLRNYFIASNNDVTIEKIMDIFPRGIRTEYVPYYLDLNSITSRSQAIINLISSSNSINEDFKPLYYLSQINIWQSRFQTNSMLILAIFLFPIVFVIRSRSAVNFSLWSVGFSSLGAEILIIFAFQVIYGYVYYMIGIIITFFMLGISLGSFFCLKVLKKVKYDNIIVAQLILVLIFAALPFIIMQQRNIQGEALLNIIIFFAIIFIIAFLSGSIFGFSTRLRKSTIEKIAGESYSSDLFGSALGAVFVSTYLLPQFGLLWTSLFISALCLLSLILLIIEKRLIYARISK